MKKALVLFAALIAQATVLPYFALYGASLNAVLVCLVWWGFSEGGWGRLFVFALFAGAALDALSGAQFGVIAMSLAAAIALSGGLALFVPRENAVHLALFIALATVWFFLVSFALMNMHALLATEFSFASLAAAVVYNIAGAFIIYRLRR